MVPVVPGRVLEFDGSLLHGVPWCDLAGEEPLEATKTRRVLVLNCWTDHAPIDADADDVDDDEGIDDEDAEEYVDPIDSAPLNIGAAAAAAACCEPRSAWQRSAIQPGVLLAQDDDDDEEVDLLRFEFNMFGTDESLITEVLATNPQFITNLNEREQPRWMRTATPAPALDVGIPSIHGEREER